MATGDETSVGDRNGGRGHGDAFWVSALRLVTPAGVVAILAVALQISGSLDRNCDATRSLAGVTLGLVQSDNGVSNAEAARLSHFLHDNVPSCGN